ncbi:511_t:CDS:2 [Funneliformis mosseae]|uniref:511_t:CDS:1 n=1 Tax=Funneliformis mosseae TaxID=27381 RepID=A0A9N8VBQ9_FUNMO|nr:511_t:CDS:2 [Funneliformis mosseae]
MRTSLLFIALTAILSFASTSEAVCVNQAVYDSCKASGDAQFSACADNNWGCKCEARKALQNCYLQCQDDIDKVNEAKAYEPATQQACTLAASQASTMAAATPTGVVPKQPVAQSPTPSPTPEAAKPEASNKNEPAKTDEKSSANVNKFNVIFAAVPVVAAAVMNL